MPAPASVNKVACSGNKLPTCCLGNRLIVLGTASIKVLTKISQSCNLLDGILAAVIIDNAPEPCNLIGLCIITISL